jgi:hypothetical protein
VADAEVVAPPAAELRIGFKDIVERRAYLRIPFVGKLLLCHEAGAPWADDNEDAHLHALQVECLAHREREQIIEGASRLGKSVLGGCKLTLAQHLPFRKVATVAKRYDHVSHEFQYLYASMKRLYKTAPSALKRLIFKHQVNYHDYDCETIWGTRSIGISVEADEGAQLLGREFTDVVCGEGSHIPPHVFNTKLLRAVDSAKALNEDQEIGEISIFTTPKEDEGCSASEVERVMKQTKRRPELLHYGRAPYAATVWIRQASIFENPAYNKDVAKAREASLKAADRHAWEEQFLGLRGTRSGKIYWGFDASRHVRTIPTIAEIRRMRLGIGIDTGANAGIVLGGIDPKWKRWALGEVYTEGGQTIWTVLEQMDEMLVERLGPCFGTSDPRELYNFIDVWVVDPASQHKPEIIDRLDVALQVPNTQDQKNLLATIDFIHDLFQSDQLFYADGFTETLIEQTRRYIWKVLKSPRRNANSPTIKEPLKEFDHLLDALRFLFVVMELYGPQDEMPPPLDMQEAFERAQKEAIHGPLREVLRQAAEREKMNSAR